MQNESSIGFTIPFSKIKDWTFIPKYYDPDIPIKLNQLSQTHELVNLGELINNGLISVKTGDEVGKMAYGTGDIPFVRTSDISGWEIRINDNDHKELFSKLKEMDSKLREKFEDG